MTIAERSEREPVRSAASALRPRSHMRRTLDGVHILLVEDNADASEVMKMVLESQGGLVMTSSYAMTALGFLARLRPDVLLTDVGLPDVDGIGLVREARTRGLLESVPVLAVTAVEMGQRDVDAAGFDAYLRKPVEANRLCETVQALVGQRGERHKGAG